MRIYENCKDLREIELEGTYHKGPEKWSMVFAHLPDNLGW